MSIRRAGFLVLLAFSACSKAQPAPTAPVSASCSYSVSAPTTTFGSAGGTGTATVTTTDGCAWTASSPVDWVRIAGETHTGNGSASFTVAASAETTARTAALLVASQHVALSQDAAVGPPEACDLTLAAQPVDLDLAGGGGQLTVGTRAGCPWTLKQDASWLSIDGPTQGSGPAMVRFAWPVNDDARPRGAAFSAGAATARVTQAGQEGCTYALTPLTDAIPRLAWSGQFTVFTPHGCAWTTSSDSGWLRLEPTSGHGTATIDYQADFNPQTSYADSRTAVAAFRWLAPTAGQNVRVNQTGDCNLGIGPATGGLPPGSTFAGGAVTAGPDGGQFHFWILTDPFIGCRWVVDSTDTWVQFDSPRVRQVMSGDGDLLFTLPPNGSSQPRRAALVMDGKPLMILQQGR